ncbi:MAG TPA: protein translocase subunit SecF [Candidatus Aminicenantes bacterium]|nr:protein translocase subunit SecF [Candidatus Aminicenantes bacterium]
MGIFNKVPEFRFMSKRFIAFALSGLVIVAGIFAFFTKGFNLGIDFTGGTMIEVAFKAPTRVGELRDRLSRVGMGGATIQAVGSEGNKFFIKTLTVVEEEEMDKKLDALDQVANSIRRSLMSPDDLAALDSGRIDLNNAAEKALEDFFVSQGISGDDGKEAASALISVRKRSETGLITDMSELDALDLKQRVRTQLREKAFLGDFTFLSVESVGPQVGKDLRTKTILATVWVLLGMLIYIGFRFKFIYGLAAVITLLHDVLVCLGAIIFFQIEMSLPVVAALLTIVGYSLNDTIVVFDRVRDNVKSMRRQGAAEIIDASVNQTLSRTLVTSLTTLIAVLCLFFLGGEVIHTFSAVLIVGVVVGTYSSIFQSCAWLVNWERHFLGGKKKFANK